MPKHFTAHRLLDRLSSSHFSSDQISEERFEDLNDLWNCTRDFHRKKLLNRFLQALSAQFENWVNEPHHVKIGLACEMAARINNAAANCKPDVLCRLYLVFSTNSHCEKHLIPSVEKRLSTESMYSDLVSQLRTLRKLKTFEEYSSTFEQIADQVLVAKAKKSQSAKRQLIVLELFRKLISLEIRATQYQEFLLILGRLEEMYQRVFSGMPMRIKIAIVRYRLAIIEAHPRVMKDYPEFGHRLFCCNKADQGLLAVALGCEQIPNSLFNSRPQGKAIRQLCKSLYGFCRSFPHHRPYVENYSCLLANWLMRSAEKMDVSVLASCDANLSRFSGICRSDSYHNNVRRGIEEYAKTCTPGQLYGLLRTYENTLVAPQYLAEVAHSRIPLILESAELRVLVRLVYSLSLMGLVDTKVLNLVYDLLIREPLKKQKPSRLLRMASSLMINEEDEKARNCLLLAEQLNVSSKAGYRMFNQWERLCAGLHIPLPRKFERHFANARKEQLSKTPKPSFMAKEVANELRTFGYQLTLEAPRFGFFIDMLITDGNRDVAIECDNPMFHRVLATNGDYWLNGFDQLKDRILKANSVPCLRFTLDNQFRSAKRRAETLAERIKSLDAPPQAVIA